MFKKFNNKTHYFLTLKLAIKFLKRDIKILSNAQKSCKSDFSVSCLFLRNNNNNNSLVKQTCKRIHKYISIIRTNVIVDEYCLKIIVRYHINLVSILDIITVCTTIRNWSTYPSRRRRLGTVGGINPPILSRNPSTHTHTHTH